MPSKILKWVLTRVKKDVSKMTANQQLKIKKKSKRKAARSNAALLGAARYMIPGLWWSSTFTAPASISPLLSLDPLDKGPSTAGFLNKLVDALENAKIMPISLMPE